MKFVSLFAGVGGFDLGMERAGHQCVAQVEWDKNAAGVLKRRWPDVPLFCDVSKVRGEDLPECEFLTFGFPCQDLSQAGLRKGLDGKRSGLFFEATRLIRELHARGSRFRFALAENVAGLFSADDGLAFARCIRELLESGACEVGWRVLDSQYFGVAQRRRRVFIVADLRGQSAEKVFSIKASLPGHPPPSRKAEKGIAGDASKGVGMGGKGYRMTALGKYEDDDLASCMKSRDYKDATDLIYQGKPASDAISDSVCSKWKTGYGGPAGCETGNMVFENLPLGADVFNGQLTGETAATLTSATGMTNATGPKVLKPKTKQGVSVQDQYLIRRLTPKECERLQGFPDEWTLEREELVLQGNEWKATGKIVKQADGPRYMQMGNAVTTNVGQWIGEQMTEAIK